MEWEFCVLQDVSRFQLGSQTHDSNKLHAPWEPHMWFWQQGNPGLQDQRVLMWRVPSPGPLAYEGEMEETKWNDVSPATWGMERDIINFISFLAIAHYKIDVPVEKGLLSAMSGDKNEWLHFTDVFTLKWNIIMVLKLFTAITAICIPLLALLVFGAVGMFVSSS